MSSMSRRGAPAVVAAILFALSAQPAAAGFGEASADVWSQRSLAIAAAVDRPVETSTDLQKSEAIGYAYFSGVKEACTGITGEHIRYGGKNMPVWAQTAQQSFCLGADNLSRAYRVGKKDKDYCGNLRTSVSNARKAKPGEDPERVVQAAAALVGAAEKLMDTRITLQRQSFLGNSSLSFNC